MNVTCFSHALRSLIQLCRVQAIRYILYSLWMISLTFFATLARRQSISICSRSDNSFNDRSVCMSYISSPSLHHVSYLSNTIKLHALVTRVMLLVRLLFYPCLRNFNNWNSKWTNMLISVSTAVFYSHVSLSRGTSRTCFSAHIREIVSWRFISATAPSLLLFYCISADLKSIAAAFCALYFLHTRHSLSPFFSFCL